MGNEANEKTEKATPRRREKERDKGHIAKSQDFTAALVLTSGIALLFLLNKNMFEKIQVMMITAFSNLNPNSISDSDFNSIFIPYIYKYIGIVAIFFIGLALCAILILRFQTGSLFAKEALKPNFNKLNPSNAFKNLIDKINFFKPKQMVEFIKSLAKMLVVAFAGVRIVLKRKNDILSLLGADPSVGLSTIGSVLFELFATICIIMIIIGIIDRYYQNYEYEKSIKMSKEEVKEERKNIEGDPKIKSRIRSTQIKIMRQKMMANVKDADVVVVNPTHFAVALKYDPETLPAPKVVAKGVDALAFRIREIAKNNGVPIVENKPLARSLYKLVEIDQFIPRELYTAVAEILQYIYTQRRK